MKINNNPIVKKLKNNIIRIVNGTYLAKIVENMKIKESKIHIRKKIIAADNCIK